MKKVRYKDMKKIINQMNNKRLLVKLDGVIIQKLKIIKAKIFLKKNRLIIKDENIEKISISIDWIANFYTNETNTSIKLEFDQNGEVLIHII